MPKIVLICAVSPNIFEIIEEHLAYCKQSVLETTGHFVLWFSFILVLRSLICQENVGTPI